MSGPRCWNCLGPEADGPDGLCWLCRPALAIEAGTDETLQAAQPVGQERGPIGNAHNAPPSPSIGSIDMKDTEYGS